ncbi:Predicted arabinose efflux permease, MFS family [Terribacillus aidingensis]|uniref:Predicted arabinose efflux permease, MFS family n=1 Tax=Terribacillus aidingensis TaxID=586416 RepID=A0A285P5H8_9BACI|nr:MFS transporter [Terribacillus aidingensis]SNZ17009.1 Predicted arabinose efflux permease, MFS family [Terribacillus aidingensis]
MSDIRKETIPDGHEIENAEQELKEDANRIKRIFQQPKAAWAVAFACVVAFMGIGLVDPILPSIAAQMDATPSQVELLFTSYLLVTGIMMLITGWLSSRIGPKMTLLIGLVIIILFSTLGGLASNIDALVGLRAGWGLGNALFISTALAVIVSVSSGGSAAAIMLYEAALGLGMSVGPLLGGLLGSIHWRGPFFGVAVLMLIGLLAVWILLTDVPKPARKSPLSAPFQSLRHPGLLTIGLTALFYNFGFFTLLTYSPFVLHLGEFGIGFVFFIWGVMLAIGSIFIAPSFESKLGTKKSLSWVMVGIIVTLSLMGIGSHTPWFLIVMIALMGLLLGINNTVMTTAVMEVSPAERSTASAAYSFLRFTGGSISPWLAGKVSEHISIGAPYYVAAAAVLVGLLLFITRRRMMDRLS